MRGCYYGPAGQVDRPHASTPARRASFTATLELFDAEKDRFPYDDGYFSTVLCCELMEHLTDDPMHMMAEINRILKPGGHLVLTTPNIGSLRAIAAILGAIIPDFFPPTFGRAPKARSRRRGTIANTRRARSRICCTTPDSRYAARNRSVPREPKPEHEWVKHLLARYELPADLRGDGIYAVGRKAGPVRERYPEWLYQ